MQRKNEKRKEKSIFRRAPDFWAPLYHFIPFFQRKSDREQRRRGMLWTKTQNKIYNCSGRESHWELCHMLWCAGGPEVIRQLPCLFISSQSLPYKLWHVTGFSNKHTPPSQYSHPGCPRLSPAGPCSSWAVCRSVLQDKKRKLIT